MDPTTFLTGNTKVVNRQHRVPGPVKDGNPIWTLIRIHETISSLIWKYKSLPTSRSAKQLHRDESTMLKVLLILTILWGSVFTEESTEETKQRKRGILGGSDGWIGIPNPHSYGYGQPWAHHHNPWKNIKFGNINLHHGGWNGFENYGKGGFALPSGTGHGPLVKTLPVYITKHVVLEKPVPVPEPVYIEKPYHIPVEKVIPVPVEKVIPVPVEKIIHKPVPVPIPVPQAYPIPVEHPVPIAVKHPVPVPVHHPYPVPVKQGIPIPVPVPVSVHSPYPGILPGPLYGRGFPPGPFYPGLHGHGHFGHGFAGHGHGFAGHGHGHFGHGFGGHGYGHGFGHDFGLGHGYGGHGYGGHHGYGGYGYGGHGYGPHGYGGHSHGGGYGYGGHGYAPGYGHGPYPHHYDQGFEHERKEKTSKN